MVRKCWHAKHRHKNDDDTNRYATFQIDRCCLCGHSCSAYVHVLHACISASGILTNLLSFLSFINCLSVKLTVHLPHWFTMAALLQQSTETCAVPAVRNLTCKFCVTKHVAALVGDAWDRKVWQVHAQFYRQRIYFRPVMSFCVLVKKISAGLLS